jgi:hypothetical protein
VIIMDDAACAALLRRGFALELVTLGWNVIGVAVLAIAAIAARSVALAGFGLDSLIEIGASTVVIWELSGTGQARQRRALRLIGYAFAALAACLLAQSTVVLAAAFTRATPPWASDGRPSPRPSCSGSLPARPAPAPPSAIPSSRPKARSP